MRNPIFLIINSFFILGCASGTLFVDTLPPEGEIYLKARSTEEYQLVGKAPYKMTAAEFRAKFGVEGPFGLEARSAGYRAQSILVTDLPQNSDLTVFLNLKSIEATGGTDENPGEVPQNRLNRAMDQIFESQRLVKVGRYDDALAQLSLLQQTHPNLSAIFEMQGGVFYIKKDYVKALDSYEKALRLNPENLELASMKRYLEKFVSKADDK